MKIIGIDPGSSFTGWGIIEEIHGSLRLIDCGVIRPKSKGKENFAARISFIYKELLAINDYYEPQEAAIEQVFTAKNALTALKLGQARGVAVAACASFEMPIFDYPPTLVKKSLVGVGHAEKEQVAFMVGKILNVKTDSFKLDTTDALGIALCHYTMRRYHNIVKKV